MEPKIFFEKINSERHQEFVNTHNNCTLCGTRLEFQYVFAEEQDGIKEEAHCPECEIRIRAKIFSLN